MKKISVLIPTYNVQNWIYESLESILNQSYEDIEVIVVDDCSTDRTYEIIEKIAEGDARVKLYKNEVNSKIVKTLNFALTKATGYYIARHDGDDVALKNRLEMQLWYLNASNLDLIGSQMIPIDESGNVIGERSELPVGENKVKLCSEFSSPITHIWLSKKSVYEKLGGYREVPYAEDYDFVLRAIDSGFRCDNPPDAYMKIRHRNGNTSDTASLSQRRGHLYALKMHKRRINGESDKYDESFALQLNEANPLVKKMHSISTLFLKKGYMTNNIVLKIAYSFLSCIFSYYNAHYLYTRFRFKKLSAI